MLRLRLHDACLHLESSDLKIPKKVFAMARWSFTEFQEVLTTIGQRRGYMPSRSLAEEQGKTFEVLFEEWWSGDEVELVDRLQNTRPGNRTWEKVDECSSEGEPDNNGKG